MPAVETNRLPAALGVNQDRADGPPPTRTSTPASWIQTMANSYSSFPLPAVFGAPAASQSNSHQESPSRVIVPTTTTTHVNTLLE